MSKYDKANYCHDPELESEAKRLGVFGQALNIAFSIGEGMYNAFDKASEYIRQRAVIKRQNKLNQPKTRLSKKEKREIIERNRSGS